MKFFRILLEGRIEDFENKYTQKFGAQNTQRLVNQVLPKYLDWVGKNFDVVNFDDNFGKLVSVLKRYEKISSNLPKTDLNQYKSFSELVDEVEKYENREKREFTKVQGGNLVYQDDRFYIVNPLTHDASCYYGKGTKWCTAAQTDTHFNSYNEEAKLFYVIDKKLQTTDPFYKVAILKRFTGEEQYWDAADRQFTHGWILETEEYPQIKEKISDYLTTQFAEQVKIFNDKEAAKKERERLYRIRIQQENQRKLDEAEERRLDGEWELGPDCPIEGMKAHALLDWLEDTSDITKLTPQDKLRLGNLKDELQELENKKDTIENEGGDVSEIDSEISDLEEELDEIEEKIDVYNIIPTGNHYYMDMFEVIGLENREYAVGTENETQRSCEDYVEQLIEDVGYEGFSRSFVMDYIDKNQLEEYARDFYYDDVNDNPEVYFDDSERDLSDEQNEEISICKDKIEILKKQISNFEDILSELEDEDEVEEIESKIEESTDAITELEEKIEEIEQNPEGNFPQDLIDDKASELAEDAVYDPANFISEFGLDYKDFIDKEEFVRAVIDADGLGGTLGTYDGTADEVEVSGQTFIVVRLN